MPVQEPPDVSVGGLLLFWYVAGAKSELNGTSPHLGGEGSFAFGHCWQQPVTCQAGYQGAMRSIVSPVVDSSHARSTIIVWWAGSPQSTIRTVRDTLVPSV